MTMRLSGPHDLFVVRMNTLRSMEEDALELLRDTETATRAHDLRELYARLAAETRQQILAIERLFDDLRLERVFAPSATMRGIESEAAAYRRATPAGATRDIAILEAAIDSQHIEIAAYSALLAAARALGESKAVRLLEAHLEQERQSSRLLSRALDRAMLDALGAPRGAHEHAPAAERSAPRIPLTAEVAR